MAAIPDRENLESMSRTDIQKLCKDNNIKANMRTDEMINALCDLVNEKPVPPSRRALSERAASQKLRSRQPSMQLSARSTSSKVDDTVTTKKAALQPSESNTDVESVVSTPGSLPASLPITRRKAKDTQTRLGKGRPVAAGGSGARKITKAFSRGNGRKPTKTSMVLHAPIAEEDEDAIQQNTPPSIEKLEATNIDPAVSPPTTDLPSPHTTGLQDTHDAPTQLPTPAPSHPSYSLPQISALETRITQLEGSDIINRLSKAEKSLSSIQSPLLDVPALKDLLKSLQAANRNVEAQVAELSKSHAELKARTNTLETQVRGLLAENTTLKQRVFELESTEQATKRTLERYIDVLNPPKDDDPKDRESSDRILPPPVEAAAPSPSQPALGKRTRLELETPDTSGTEVGRKPKDADMDAIHRVKRPQRKKPRLDPDEDTLPFPFIDKEAGPSSTSTPKQPSTPWHGTSKSPPGFFTAGRAPTPLEKKEIDMEFYLHFDEDIGQRSDNEREKPIENNEQGRRSPERPRSAIPRTPSPRLASLSSVIADRPLNPIHDPNFFAGVHPVFQSHVQASELPFPLIPTTPPNPTETMNQSAQYATPRLGEPWRPQSKTSDTQGSGTRSVSGSDNLETSGASRSPPSPGNYGLRPGTSRRERNDKYNPYFTPQRGPGGGRQRTGLTPIRGFSSSLKSPAPLATVAEDEHENAEDDNATEASPPQIRTLYGTELHGDSRFGDFGRDLGLNKFLPR